MATPAEKKALLFFGVVIALGTSSRVLRVHRSPFTADAAARAALETQLAAADSARHATLGKGKARRKKRPALPPASLDLDIATEPEIEALRGIGPSLARRIVADRDSFGPFGSKEGLKRVKGVGPGLVAKLDSTVTFSLLPRPMNTVISGRSARPKISVRRRPRNQARDTLR